MKNSSENEHFEQVLENNSQISQHLNIESSFYQQPSHIHVNEEQNFWKEKQNEKRTVCPCTKSTAEDVVLMCLTLGLRHNLLWQAQVDILKMINAMYGDERIPNSKYIYFSYIDRAVDNFTYTFIVPNVKNILEIGKIYHKLSTATVDMLLMFIPQIIFYL